MGRWKCPVCGREFSRKGQDHYCVKPESIDGYIAAQEESVRPRLEKLRDILRKTMPEAEERISWSMPTFWKGRNLIHFAAFKNHIGLYPGEEAVAAFAGKLEGFDVSKGTIRLPHSRELPEELIGEIAGWCYRSCPGGNCSASARKIRRLAPEEVSSALSLAWKVFSEYESPEYSREGTEEFRRSLRDEEFLAGIEYYGAFDKGEMVGMAGIRPGKMHICLFFVDGGHHRRGIGTKMFERIRTDHPGENITLNSSPYGVPFYHALGFRDLGAEKTVNGIRFTPMEYEGKGAAE